MNLKTTGRALFFFILFFENPALCKNELKKIVIDIQSVNQKLNQSLEQKLKPYKEKDFLFKNEPQILKTLQKTLLSKGYVNSQIKTRIRRKKNKVALSYKIEHPYRYDIIIKGSEKVNKLSLYKMLKTAHLFHNAHFTSALVDKIKDYYESLSFIGTKVKAQKVIDKKNYHIKIIMSLSEGERKLLKRLKISSVKNPPPFFYQRLFQTYAPKKLKRGWFNQREFDQTITRIVAHLRQMGYYHAQIEDQDIKEQGENMFIKVRIRRGPPLRLRKLEIKNNSVFSTKEIKKIIGLRPMDTIHIMELEEKIEKLIQKYQDRGYLSAEIENKEKMLKIKNTFEPVDIVLKIKEGKIFHAPHFKVRGLQNASADFVRRSSNLKRGGLITRKKLKTSSALISDTGLFSNVLIDPQSGIIDVREQDLKSLRTKLGISTLNTLSFGASLDGSIKKFLEDERSQIALNTKIYSNIHLVNQFQNSPANLFEYEVLGNYKKLYLFNTRWNGHISYSFSKELFSFESEDNPLTWALSQKTSFNLEKKMDLNTFFNFKVLGLERLSSRTAFMVKTTDQWINTTGFSYVIDNRSDVFFPKKGGQFSSMMEYASPLLGTTPLIHFLKTQAEYKFYIPQGDLVWAFLVSGGLIQPFQSKSVPYKHLFILGGPHNLRGYDGLSDGLRVPSQEAFPAKDPNDLIPSSSLFYLVKSEIRFPLIKKSLRGAFFYDRGAVFMKKSLFKKDVGHSIGLSLHYITPLGPFSAHIAYRLDKRQSPKGDKRYSISGVMGAF